MAKQKKSRVTGAFGPKERPTPAEAEKAAEKAAEALTGKKVRYNKDGTIKTTNKGRPRKTTILPAPAY
jgi:hypothetical protein